MAWNNYQKYSIIDIFEIIILVTLFTISSNIDSFPPVLAYQFVYFLIY